MLGKTSIDVEVHPQLTITEETAETCLWLLGKYLDANPDKTLKVTTEPGGDGFVRKVEIVPEWKEKPKKIGNCSSCLYGFTTGLKTCGNKESPCHGQPLRDGMGCSEFMRK